MPRTLPTTRNTLGHRLRKYRKERGWTLENLRDEARLATGTISDLERNRHKPNMTTLVKLTKALGVSLKDLTGA